MILGKNHPTKKNGKIKDEVIWIYPQKNMCQNKILSKHLKTGWWFQIFLFSPLLYFSKGLKPPTRKNRMTSLFAKAHAFKSNFGGTKSDAQDIFGGFGSYCTKESEAHLEEYSFEVRCLMISQIPNDLHKPIYTIRIYSLDSWWM